MEVINKSCLTVTSTVAPCWHQWRLPWWSACGPPALLVAEDGRGLVRIWKPKSHELFTCRTIWCNGYYPVRQNLDCKEVGDPFEWLTILALCSRRSICKKTCKDNYQKRGLPVYCKAQLASTSESSTPPMKLHKSCLHVKGSTAGRSEFFPATGKLQEISQQQCKTCSWTCKSFRQWWNCFKTYVLYVLTDHKLTVRHNKRAGMTNSLHVRR